MLAHRISLFSGSGTAAAREAAKAAAAQGREIADLAAGEVIAAPPASVREGAIAAIQAGVNRYTDSIGLPCLRKAVAKKLSTDTGFAWDTDNIVITAGAKQGLLDASLTLLDPGDEVIIIRPCWPTFPSQVCLAGGKPVFVDARPPSYVPEIHAIRGAVTPKTKAIIINSPNNPTGAVYDRTTLQAVGDLAINYNLWIVSDECYSSFVFVGHRHQSITAAHPSIRSRTILVNAFSKELAITGWRLGYLAAPPEIVAAAKKLQSMMTSNANVIAQHAILHHLEVSDGSYEREIYRRLAAARKAGLRVLCKLKDVAPPRADGSFFFYLDLKTILARLPRTSSIRTAEDIARILLEQAGVASVAGSTFGDEAGLRLSFGAPPETIEPALEKVVATLNDLKSHEAAA
ncbi:aminotransferase class I/II-fold pyridoxal phosphate-dependent enzyme [Mesorhizobium sp. VK23B]|uniref:aspartate transaminase n=1 Tax=Mesorhizobium dulcispinae TaxID=3072316 RepID=A0ABU4XP84_9HYPH|nr:MULTISPECIES: aminotransferase class I/II-fold pyridoxal phosphate-dependent enzyme [unclassified Mesorhizobium]MDX8470158.1 aminotransferase class I/II-fold pyridoxal phosphate-dependent enzyme [Mesorhizobium sp. VK23B]MDX8476566.1 aminotransferase class I/II-fold pyridoxal phosphate-dependent enzyme [Mesorhizobium sp. VK23A]